MATKVTLIAVCELVTTSGPNDYVKVSREDNGRVQVEIRMYGVLGTGSDLNVNQAAAKALTSVKNQCKQVAEDYKNGARNLESAAAQIERWFK